MVQEHSGFDISDVFFAKINLGVLNSFFEYLNKKFILIVLC